MNIDGISDRERALHYVLLVLEEERKPMLIDDVVNKIVAKLFQNKELFGGVPKLFKIDVEIDSLYFEITDETRASVFNIVSMNDLAKTGYFQGIIITPKGLSTLEELTENIIEKDPIST